MIETVETKFDRLTEPVYDQMRLATRKAGRGELIGYTNPEIKVASQTHRCERCGVEVRDDAYRQVEKTYLGGRRVDCAAYYCNDCAAVLKAIGAGEQTAMAERRGAPIYEPATKADGF